MVPYLVCLRGACRQQAGWDWGDDGSLGGCARGFHGGAGKSRGYADGSWDDQV